MKTFYAVLGFVGFAAVVVPCLAAQVYLVAGL